MCSGEISKLEIQWSPIHENKFITWGPDVRMYEVSSTISESPKNNDVPKGKS